MQVKIIFDIEENEYICFVPNVIDIVGYGETEKKAVYNFLLKCENNPLFNQHVISHLIQKLS